MIKVWPIFLVTTFLGLTLLVFNPDDLSWAWWYGAFIASVSVFLYIADRRWRARAK